MTGNGYTEQERFTLSVEKTIAGDMTMGNFSQIDHIWVRPDNACFVGMTTTGGTVLEYLVPHSLDIQVNDRNFQHGSFCEVHFQDGQVTVINLQIDRFMRDVFGVHLVSDHLKQTIREIGHRRLEGATIHIHNLFGFVVSYGFKIPLTLIREQIVLTCSVEIPGVAFVVVQAERVD